MHRTSTRLAALALFAITLTATCSATAFAPREETAAARSAAPDAGKPVILAQTGCSRQGGCR